MTTLEMIRAEIERLHYHPKLDFIKNDEVVDMALEIIDKYAEQEQSENLMGIIRGDWQVTFESGLTDEMMEHYKKLAEHYNGGTHESIQDTNDGK